MARTIGIVSKQLEIILDLQRLVEMLEHKIILLELEKYNTTGHKVYEEQHATENGVQLKLNL